MVLLLVIAIVWTLVALTVVAACVAAADGDKTQVASTPPSRTLLA